MSDAEFIAILREWLGADESPEPDGDEEADGSA